MTTPRAATSYQTAKNRGREEEARRWRALFCAVVQCANCRRTFIAGEPGCRMCATARRLFETGEVDAKAEAFARRIYP